jgi:CheY-like chemotaxis protein
MNKSGPIIIIDDDLDDQMILGEIFTELRVQNEIFYFVNGIEAYAFLVKTKHQPFIILSDINMPKLNGIELRDKVHNNAQLNLKCIPYLFFTTASEQKVVVDAYSKSVQGFFVKPQRYEELRRIINNIIEYWKDCHSPRIDVEPPLVTELDR